jgi:hypothetical protein
MTANETLAIGLAAALLVGPYVPRLCRRVRRAMLSRRAPAAPPFSVRPEHLQMPFGEVLAIAQGNAPDVAPPPAGRQVVSRWEPAIPAKAQSAFWEDAHRFAPGCKPTRDSTFGILHMEPPLSLICPACELEQAPLLHGDRRCGYCGLRLHLHGSRLYWWRPSLPEVPEWEPKR